MTAITQFQPGDRVRHLPSRKAGVYHGPTPDSGVVLVRYGRETRPTMVIKSDLVKIK